MPLTELENWQEALYRIETTDYLLGGENGILNVQAKILGARTRYLKKLLETMGTDISGFDLDMQAHMQAALKFALEQSALANSGVRALHKINQQQGEFTLYNYGIVSSAVVSKKGSNRLLSISAGVCYLEGRKYYVPAQDSAVSVPVGEAVNGTVYAYLQLVAGIPTLKITTISNPTPPPVTVTLLSITIPALDSGADLAACTLSSRLCPTEPDYPNSVGTPATITVPLAFVLPDTAYTLEFEVLSAVGSPCDERNLKVTTRNTNNFIVTLLSAADDVVVRWKLSRLNSVSAHPTNDWRSRFAAYPSNSTYPTA
ncbi:MAG: hypothetical protein HY849_00255 [Nitrosomonadales bacterium]|nr:hypothetical protein [Nitrosomonadales bacterium]